MAPKFVAPYRLGKNDAAAAAGICEAVQRPNMRFVPIKNLVAQQGWVGIHRARLSFVKARAAQANQIRVGIPGEREQRFRAT